MKVLIISDAQSVHTQRWVSSLSEKGVEVVLYSIKPYLDDFYSSRNIKCYFFDLFSYKRDKSGIKGALKRHFQAVKHLKKVLKEVKPDILHAHYVTSYSLIAALSGFHPLIVSIWGSDVYIFPKQLKINEYIVRYTLSKADKILSTSHVMTKDGTIYPVTLHIAKAKDGRNILYDVNVKINEGVATDKIATSLQAKKQLHAASLEIYRPGCAAAV
jgi:UDP-N-acetylglucosamine:LPS N-acetylglucosamine transferase